MFEKFYSLLLRLYPAHFRRAWGDEALRLVLDRARDEKGFLRRLRLWFDLLIDLAISLPREYSKAPAPRSLAASPENGAPSFQLLTERPVNPALLFFAGLLTAASFWICTTAVAHSRRFPAQFPPDSHSLQALVQSDFALARSDADSSPVGVYRFCITAHRDIPRNSLQPLLRLNFAAPGASGAALIDGKVISTFKNEQRLSITTDMPAGDHWFVVRVDRPAGNASISRNGNFESCPPE